MPRILQLLKCCFAVYCITVCVTLIVLVYGVCVTPFLLIHKPLERRCQEFLQRLAIFIVLSALEYTAHSQLVLSLPAECGPEMEALVYSKLKGRYLFEEGLAEQLAHVDAAGLDRRRDIIISNHQLYLDWIYIWCIMVPLVRAGSVKIILKRSLMSIPVLGIVGAGEGGAGRTHPCAVHSL